MPVPLRAGFFVLGSPGTNQEKYWRIGLRRANLMLGKREAEGLSEENWTPLYGKKANRGS